MQPTTNPPTAFPTHPTDRACRECDGEGQIEVQDPGPYSRDAIEPTWSLSKCEECHGSGVVTVERCDRCGLAEVGSGEHAWDSCRCSGEELGAWMIGNRAPVVWIAALHVATYLLTRHPDGGTVHHPGGQQTFRSRVAVVARELRDLGNAARDHRGSAERRLAAALTLVAE